MSKHILRRSAIAGLWHRIEQEHKEKLKTVCHENLFRILEDHMIVRDSPRCWIVFQSLAGSARWYDLASLGITLTVLRREHNRVRTSCLCPIVVMYVIARTPCTGSMSARDQRHIKKGRSVPYNVLAGVNMDLLDRVKSSLRISKRLFSNSLLVPIGLLQPTPLCQMARCTLSLAFDVAGMVKLTKNKRSIRVSISSSAKGLASKKSDCSS